MKTILYFAMASALFACSDKGKQTKTQVQDSIENAEVKQVEDILRNEDSLMKAKEQELLEKYGK